MTRRRRGGIQLNAGRKYTFDGTEINVPLRYDEKTGGYIEDYREWMENIVCTPSGHPIMFAGEDACELAKGIEQGGCPDCGSCVFYRRADEHTWIGICTNEKKSTKSEKSV